MIDENAGDDLFYMNSERIHVSELDICIKKNANKIKK